MNNDHEKRLETTTKIRESLMSEFEELQDLRDSDSLSDKDLDYALSRDRKAGLILKTVQMEMQSIVLEKRLGKTTKTITPQ